MTLVHKTNNLLKLFCPLRKQRFLDKLKIYNVRFYIVFEWPNIDERITTIRLYNILHAERNLNKTKYMEWTVYWRWTLQINLFCRTFVLFLLCTFYCSLSVLYFLLFITCLVLFTVHYLFCTLVVLQHMFCTCVVQYLFFTFVVNYLFCAFVV